MATISQVSIAAQSPHVSYPFCFTQFLISQTLQWANFTPSSRQPVQLMDSNGSSGTLYIFCQLAAVDFLNASLFSMVAMRALQLTQFRPQQDISFSIKV